MNVPKLFIVVNVDWFFLSHRKEIALHAKQSGYSVTIVTNDTGKRSEIESLGFRMINLPMQRSGQNIIEEIKACLFLFNLYKKEQPDLVHHVGLKAIIWGTLAAKFSKVQGVVNAVSGLGTVFTEKSIKASALLLLMRIGHSKLNVGVIFQNSDDKKLFIKYKIIEENQTFQIDGSGVNLDEYSYTKEPEADKIVVLLTARMIVEKGVLVLIEAAKILKDEYNGKVEFLLCGGIDDNPNALSINKLMEVCDNDYIQWLGYRSDVISLLRKCHIVAFPSYYREGIPKSLIEATAIGRPIITTNSTGCKEVVINDFNGFLIPIKNSISLAEKLKILIDNKDLRVQMGKNSRLLAEKYYSIEKVVQSHLNIYKIILTKRS